MRPSSVWKPAVPADHREGEGCSRHLPPALPISIPCAAELQGQGRLCYPPLSRGWPGWQAGGSSPPLMKCFRPHSQNDFDILEKERNLTRHCAWLAKLLLTTRIKVDGSQSASLCYLFLIRTYCQEAISRIGLEDSVCKCCIMFEL